ncbi:MAG TPA: hypothetical protein VF478_02710 [Anaerolineae bacterium]
MNSILSKDPHSIDPASKPVSTEPIVCFTNIGPQQQRIRMVFGLVAFAVGIGIAALLFLIDASVWWRLLVFFPFAGAGMGYFQARDKT